MNLGQRRKGGKKSFEHSGRYISLIKYDYFAFLSQYIIDHTHTRAAWMTGTQVAASVGRPLGAPVGLRLQTSNTSRPFCFSVEAP